MKKFPPMIHNKAGSQPNVIPMNGPRIGPRAATLLNWYPQSTYRLTGKYSTPSMYMWAGVAFFASERQTFRSIHLPYPQYATAYSAIVATTHRNAVASMSTIRLPPTTLARVTGYHRYAVLAASTARVRFDKCRKPPRHAAIPC